MPNTNEAKSVTRASDNQLELSDIIAGVSSAVVSKGWKKYSAGESSEIDYNYRFDLYIRRRNLSELLLRNDDITKKSSNISDSANRSEASKINRSGTFWNMVSNPPMGNPKKDMTPSTIRSVLSRSNSLPVLD